MTARINWSKKIPCKIFDWPHNANKVWNKHYRVPSVQKNMAKVRWTEFLLEQGLVIAFYYPWHESIIIIDYFIVSVEPHHWNTFRQNLAFPCLINKLMCHQSKIATCILLILTNKKSLFKLSDNFEVYLSDHH